MKRHRTADLEPTSFGGRYTLLRRLAIGGMAEIYLARQARIWSGVGSAGRAGSTAGFEKEVVIKRLRAELADDPRIVEMFLDEARIGALLNHPNIVHVYDVDEHDGIPYIAMEYIVGEELNELCRRGIAQDRFLPLEHAVELMRQAAAGMGYFHAKRGVEGTALANEPLRIVHLDISPSNLLVTQDGFLKVIDFGIASAEGQRSRGDVIPGKLGYMSPEQAARAINVDHRSDIFSLGIVLYEITVGKRLFRGAAQDVVKRLISAEIEPPTFARRSFPTGLEAIVMRALEKHPEDRYQSAYDLADDLETFLRDERLHSGPVRIARYLDMLTHAAGGQRRPELVSEAEVRAGTDDLDFDSQLFDTYTAVPGAPGPAQAREWEDTEQPEADVAAALGMELDELRALRTPVPTRPSGMMPITGKEPRAASRPEEEATVTEGAVRRRATTDVGDDDGENRDPGDEDAPTIDQARTALNLALPPPSALPTPAPAPPPLSFTSHAHPASQPHAHGAHAPASGPRVPPSGPRGVQVPASGPRVAPPVFGQSLLPPPREAQHLPWILVGALGVAVIALVAYIVMQ